MARTSPDLVDLFEQLRQDTSAMVAYGDLACGGNGRSRMARVGMHACSQRLSLTVQEMERILSGICVFRPTSQDRSVE